MTNVTWDYRIFKQDFNIANDCFSGFFIVEASYEEGILTGISSVDSPCAPYGMDIETLKEDFKVMSLAFQSPILTINDLPENNLFIQKSDTDEEENNND